MGVNEHFELIYNAVSCQLRGFKTASEPHQPFTAWLSESSLAGTKKDDGVFTAALYNESGIAVHR
jgi:hypothetical protein